LKKKGHESKGLTHREEAFGKKKARLVKGTQQRGHTKSSSGYGKGGCMLRRALRRTKVDQRAANPLRVTEPPGGGGGVGLSSEFVRKKGWKGCKTVGRGKKKAEKTSETDCPRGSVKKKAKKENYGEELLQKRKIKGGPGESSWSARFFSGERSDSKKKGWKNLGKV